MFIFAPRKSQPFLHLHEMGMTLNFSLKRIEIYANSIFLLKTDISYK